MFKKITLCLVLASLIVNEFECKRFSSGGSRSGYSGSYSRSSSSVRNFPRTSNSYGSGSRGRVTYPSSTGLSGSSSRHGTNSGASIYPPSSGLSGTRNFNKHDYPSSSGLSGTGKSTYPSAPPLPSGKAGYPPSLSGLSGSNNPKHHGYPSTSGLSGRGKSSYPSSSGLSGDGSRNYGHSTSGYGLSGYGRTIHRPQLDGSQASWKYGLNRNHNFGSTYEPKKYTHHSVYPTSHSYYGGSYVHPSFTHFYSNPSSYYSAPQYVYVKEYRGSGSRFSDLLTGLALYNMVRSQNHYDHHYYYDDYYRNRYNSYSPVQELPSSTSAVPSEEAVCRIKIKDDKTTQIVRIPCEIVTTFTQNSTKELTKDTDVICSNSTNNSMTNFNSTSGHTANIINSDISKLATVPSEINLNSPIYNAPAVYANANNLTEGRTNPSTETYDVLPLHSEMNNSTNHSIFITNQNTDAKTPLEPYHTEYAETTTMKNNTASQLTQNMQNGTESKLGNEISKSDGDTVHCFEDALQVKGSQIKTENLDCTVEIKKKDEILSHKVNCSTLMEYAKMPEPKKETGIWASIKRWWHKVVY